MIKKFASVVLMTLSAYSSLANDTISDTREEDKVGKGYARIDLGPTFLINKDTIGGSKAKIRNAMTFGFGAGIYGPMVRADVTLNYGLRADHTNTVQDKLFSSETKHQEMKEEFIDELRESGLGSNSKIMEDAFNKTLDSLEAGQLETSILDSWINNSLKELESSKAIAEVIAKAEDKEKTMSYIKLSIEEKMRALFKQVPEEAQAIMTANPNDIVVNRSIKRGHNINSIMVNGYIDVVRNNNFSLFVGGGVGMSRIMEKATETAKILVAGNEVSSETSSAKSDSNNFAYSLTVGGTIPLSPSIDLELAYSYKDFGTTKFKNHPEFGKTKYNMHVATLGFRFDF